MFITEIVRNIAWSLRNTRARRAQRDDSVLPADALARVEPVREQRERRTAEDLVEDRVRARRTSRRPAAPADVGVVPQADAGQPVDASPPSAAARPHIDIRV
jgi:hypothetical protein